MNILMLSCKKASALIDKKLEVELSTKEKIMLSMHTAMCDGCNAYKKQSVILDNLLFKHFQESNETKIPFVINNDLKEQIISKLK